MDFQVYWTPENFKEYKYSVYTLLGKSSSLFKCFKQEKALIFEQLGMRQHEFICIQADNIENVELSWVETSDVYPRK